MSVRSISVALFSFALFVVAQPALAEDGGGKAKPAQTDKATDGKKPPEETKPAGPKLKKKKAPVGDPLIAK